jgi:FkbM family methyltransferase
MIKQLIRQSLRFFPLKLIEWFVQFDSGSPLHRIGRLGLSNRDVTMTNGLGAGLKFNAGLSNPDYALGTNELPVQQALASCLKPGDTFYDIGANVGFFTVIGAKLVGASGRVYAFEPVRENVAIIQRNIKLNNFHNVTVLEKAVSSSTGQGELLLAEYAGGHTLLTAGTPPDVRGVMRVDLVAIDDLVAQQTLPPPDVVKIDVEGAELDVLHGMSQTLQHFQPTIIYEVDDSDRESFKRKRQDIEEFIRSIGYKSTSLAEAYPAIGWHVGHAIAIPDNCMLSLQVDNQESIGQGLS